MKGPQHFAGDSRRSQSETIGVVLLTGVIVLAVGGFSLLAVSNFNDQAKEDEVAASIEVEVTADNITVTHNGGDTLDDKSLRLITRAAGSEQRYAFGTEALIEPADGDGKFEPGEEYVFAHSMTGTATLLVVDSDRSILLDQTETQVPPDTTIDPPNFRIRIDNTDSPVTEGETLTVRPTVTNVGDTRGTQTVELSIDGNGVVATESMTLAGGETEQIRLGWLTSDGDAGDYDATVTTDNDSDTETVTVRGEPNFQVSIDSTNSPVTERRNLSVTATVQNTGGSPGIQNIKLNVSGQSNPVDIEEIGLNDGDSRQLTLTWPTEVGDTGSYDATIASDDTSATQGVTVQAADKPGVTSIVMDGAPINYTEAAASERQVTITYDEQMNTSVKPTVTLSGVSASDPSADPGWISTTTYVKTFNIAQNDEDVTATVSVSGAQNSNGTVQESATADFIVDTQLPGDVNDIVVKPDINIANQTAVTYGIKNPDTVYDDEDISVTLTGPSGKTVTKRTPLQNGAGGITDVTLDASTLDDGPVSIEAVAIDDVNNTGSTVQESSITKDTVAPTVSDYTVVSDKEGEFTVRFNATERTTSIADVSITASGPGQIDSLVASNNNTDGNTTSYELNYSVTQDGVYDVKLVRILDGVGNNGSTGQTASVNTRDPPEITSATLNGSNDYVDITFSEGVYTASDGTGGVTKDDFSLLFTQNGGDVTDVTITSIETTSGASPSGGETTLRAQLDVTNGPAAGVEIINITAADGSSIYDSGGTAMNSSESTGNITLNDQKPPKVTVEDPDGGEQIVGGSTYVINWSTSSDRGDVDFDSIDIEYSTDGGDTYTPIATDTVDSASGYNWDVNDTIDSSNMLIRVSADDDAGNTGSDTSNSTFTVDSSPPSVDTFTGLSASKNDDTITIGSLSITDDASGLSSVDIVVRDSGGNIIGTDNSSNLGGTATFSASDLQVSTSGIQPNEQYTVTVVATDEVGKETSASDTTMTSGPVADANGPYTVDEDSTVPLDGSGSNPQTGNPTYQWSIVSGPGNITDANSQSATYEAPTNVDSDTEVTVRLTVTESNGNGDAYTDETNVTVRNISQSGNEGNSPAGFSGSISASNIPRGSNSATQQLEFTLNKTLADGETVTINLDAAQNVKNGDADPVDYQSASINSATSGSASVSAGTDSASVTYTANGDVSAGTMVSIEVSDIETTNSNSNTGPFDVVFTRSDGTSETTTFSLT